MISGEGSAFELQRFHGTPDEVSAQWLAARRDGVGGSDVAAIMGLSPWSSAYQTWVSKVMGEDKDLSGNPAVEWGNILEPIVGGHYAANHPDRIVRRVNGIARSVARPWAQASLDYEVKDPELGWGVLEIKTAGYRGAFRWDEGVPLYYQTQVAHYLSVTGRPFADVAVLIGGSDYREFRIMRDEEDVAAVDKAVDDFWRENVVGGVEPEPTFSDGAAVLAAHGDPSNEVIEADELPYEFARYKLACAEYDRAKRERDAWASKCKAYIGDSRGISTPEGRYTWMRRARTGYDYKLMDEEHPGLREGYSFTKEVDGGLMFYPAKD